MRFDLEQATRILTRAPEILRRTPSGFDDEWVHAGAWDRKRRPSTAEEAAA